MARELCPTASITLTIKGHMDRMQPNTHTVLELLLQVEEKNEDQILRLILFFDC